MNPFRRNPSAIALGVLAPTALVAAVWANETIARGVWGFSEAPTDEELTQMVFMQLLQAVPGPTIPVAVLATIALCLVGAVTASGGRLRKRAGDPPDVADPRDAGDPPDVADPRDLSDRSAVSDRRER